MPLLSTPNKPVSIVPRSKQNGRRRYTPEADKKFQDNYDAIFGSSKKESNAKAK
jgi:hypothetical protein